VSDQKSVGWCLIPPWVMAHPGLNITEKVLYGRVLGLSGNRGCCYASNQWLAGQIGVAPQTVANHLSHLAKLGMISVTQERQGERTVKRWIVPKWGTEDLTATGKNSEGVLTATGKDFLPPAVSRGVDVRVDKTSCAPSERTSKDYAPAFESFWQAYPRKIAKAGAYRKWQALVKRNGAGPGTEALLTAAQHYQQACRMAGTEENFVMHAATFLGPQLRWEDYLSPPKPTDGKQADWRTERLSELAKQIKRVDLEIGYLSQKLQAGGDEEDMSRHEELLATRERLAEEGKRVKEGVR